MPINRLAYTKTPASQPASEGMLPASNPSNYGNATSKVINLTNNTWLGDSVVFTVDSAWRYVVHVRNTNHGASSIHIDDVRVYGKNTASYLLCGSGGEGYRFGFGGQEKENDISGVEGGHLSYQYRIHDARLGRFLSVDPLAPEYPWNSTYAFAENKVIQCIDLEGLESWVIIDRFTKNGDYLETVVQLTSAELVSERASPTGTMVRYFKEVGKEKVFLGFGYNLRDEDNTQLKNYRYEHSPQLLSFLFPKNSSKPIHQNIFRYKNTKEDDELFHDHVDFLGPRFNNNGEIDRYIVNIPNKMVERFNTSGDYIGLYIGEGQNKEKVLEALNDNGFDMSRVKVLPLEAFSNNLIDKRSSTINVFEKPKTDAPSEPIINEQ